MTESVYLTITTPVSKPRHAVAIVHEFFAVFSGFSPRCFGFSWNRYLFYPRISLTSTAHVLQITLSYWSLTTGSAECLRSGSSQNLDGHDSRPGRLKGSRSLRPLPARSIPYNQ